MSGFVLFVIVVVCANVIPRIIAASRKDGMTASRRSRPAWTQTKDFGMQTVVPSEDMFRQRIRAYLKKRRQEGFPLEQVMLPPQMINYMSKCGLTVKNILVMLTEVRGELELEGEEPEPVQMPAESKPRDPHVGESYASPIPEPHQSPMVGRTSPAIRHSQEHIVSGTLHPEVSPGLHSDVAEHVDEHIATTHAVPTPVYSRREAERRRAARLAEFVPRGQKGLSRALVMKEIVDKPLSMR